MQSASRLLFLIPLLALCPSHAGASDFGFSQGSHDPAVPTQEAVIGHAPGERISSPEQIHRYFQALAEAMPDRIRLVDYAESWQGRPLFYAIIGTPERLADLDAIQTDIQTIAHPHRNEQADIDAALERVPATAWLAYSVHGNEISPADAAMVTAWHLLSAENDPLVERILSTSLVFINPLQNPDGRARFIHHFEAGLGLEPDPSRLAAEHDEPWPSGRVNHYLFDLNRDWLSQTQPETRGHIEALLDWYPLAFVDAHEMGPDSTFFFAPEAVPYNPLLSESQRASLTRFGENNARWFDRHGFAYFTREIFDAFYPGYGASWPSYYGGIAMTYEQGSARGLVMRLRNGREMSYLETVREYVAASLATLETVAVQRDRLWADFAAYRREGIEAGRRQGPAAWAIPAQRDQGAADRLGELLARHGAEVYRSADALDACGQTLGAGSYLIPAAQPAYRKLRVLLDEQIDMDEDFLAEQERRRARGLADQIYDVTAWSLPLMFNVDVQTCRRAPTLENLDRIQPSERPAGRLENPDARVAFVAGGESTATLRLMAAALRAGLTIDRSEQAFSLGETRYPAGSLIFQRADNPDHLVETLQRLAADTGAMPVGTDTSWITDGPSFGSNRVRRLMAPRVALAWDAPTDVYSPGAVRFILERQFGYPVTPIRVATLASADLNRYDVVILPDASRWRGSYAGILGAGGARNLRDWINDGGTLVTMAGGTEWAAHPDVDLLSARLELSVEEEELKIARNDEARVPGREFSDIADLEQALKAGERSPDSVSGILAATVVDGEHWLGAGAATQIPVLVRGNRIFTPLRLDQGENVVRYAGPEEVLASGYVWEENRRQLAFKPYLMTQTIGRGRVIGFAEDPAVRAYLDGQNSLLINAVLVAPAYSRKLR
ncbi:M14 family metallopeptidase [Wenzhouxiangella marina]|uniref:Zinc carboxypeptidase n=1 Tax=Wenzhouxiangella marina TaxID=1579979 RepID=A0A0K0XYX2_9GAMM|nr:M14 family metallopeptidase [Wenzhouxiangella marina]AKS42870.1 Zinc carboxypeptidase [Wenzhouxiangella marina]MBB6087448.1 hypothetical protein [Wenzhouxiangella marina]